jgi:hypothetical protein
MTLAPYRLRLVCVLAALGCADPAVQPAGMPKPGTPPVSSPNPDAPGLGLPPFPDAGAADAAAVSTPKPGDQCAEDVQSAHLSPVDLLLLVDASGSMAEKAGARTRWELARDALAMFLRDGRSAGLGVGLQLFPLHPGPCTSDGFCFLPSPGGCRALSACLAPNAPLGSGQACGADGDPACPGGTACTPLGRCTISGGDCVAMGQPCPGGIPNDMCGARPRQCRFGPSSRGSCEAADYQKPTVPVLEVPAGAARLVGAMDTRLPLGATPLGVAAQGALMQLRARRQADPTRRPVLVIVTDGVPQGCASSNDITAALQMANTGTPPITTYVVAVLADTDPPAARATVEGLAVAGGSGVALIVSPNDQLSDKLLAALNQIRGASVPCELTIPWPTMGQLDFGKVNVRVNSTSGPSDLVYVATADRCATVENGWYYDVDPAQGAPTRVRLCPKVCERLKADPKGSVEVRFGCRSRTIE